MIHNDRFSFECDRFSDTRIIEPDTVTVASNVLQVADSMSVLDSFLSQLFLMLDMVPFDIMFVDPHETTGAFSSFSTSILMTIHVSRTSFANLDFHDSV